MFIQILLIILIVMFILERIYYYNGDFLKKNNKSIPLIDSNISEYKPLDIPPID